MRGPKNQLRVQTAQIRAIVGAVEGLVVQQEDTGHHVDAVHQVDTVSAILVDSIICKRTPFITS